MTDVRVFINYRRRDTRHVAGRLRDRFVAQYGPDTVFVDVESILPGQDYVEAIDSAVSRCLVMCVLIGETWLSPDADGTRRIDDENDRLRLEIEAGLRHRTVVVPVLVDEATMPDADDLPGSLEPLSRHQGVRIRYDSFDSDADRLLKVIGRIADEGLPTSSQDIVRPPTTETRTTTRPRAGTASVVRRIARWVAVGALVLAALYLLGTGSQMGDVVAASRSALPESWGTPVWLLPVLPIGLAVLLSLTHAGSDIALGCTAGAAWWVLSSLVLVTARVPGAPHGQHLAVLALLVVAGAALLVADPGLRARAPAHHTGPAVAATLLMVAAMMLRGLAPWVAQLVSGNTGQPFDVASLTGDEAFWLAVAAPLLICVPAIVGAPSPAQLRALVTLATLLVVYPFVLRVLMFSGAAAARTPLYALVDDLVFMAGSICMLSSVRAVQARTMRHDLRALAGGVGVPQWPGGGR